MTLVLFAMPLSWGVRRHLRGELDWFEIVLIIGMLNVFYFGVGALWLRTNPEQLFSKSLAPYITAALGPLIYKSPVSPSGTASPSSPRNSIS